MGGFFFFQAEDGIRDLVRSRGLGDVYKRQSITNNTHGAIPSVRKWRSAANACVPFAAESCVYRNTLASKKIPQRKTMSSVRPTDSVYEQDVASAKSRSRPSERIILGIDPGTTVMGFGVLLVQNSKVALLEAGAIRFTVGDDHTLKLRAIFKHVTTIIATHHPDELAIEAQFFGKNVQSMLKLGRAQGVAIAAALNKDISVVEYAPKRVKQSITGNGNASKEQVAAMLHNILNVKELPSSTDATDAIAVAVCHHFANSGIGRRSSSRGSAKDWSSFLRNNPDRVK